MNEDSLRKLALALLAATVLLSAVVGSRAAHARHHGSPGGGAWALLGLTLVLGFVGRAWLLARRKDKSPEPPRKWRQRRRALPPPPDGGDDRREG